MLWSVRGGRAEGGRVAAPALRCEMGIARLVGNCRRYSGSIFSVSGVRNAMVSLAGSSGAPSIRMAPAATPAPILAMISFAGQQPRRHSRSWHFDDEGAAHAAAGAHRGHAEAAALAAQLVD